MCKIYLACFPATVAGQAYQPLAWGHSVKEARQVAQSVAEEHYARGAKWRADEFIVLRALDDGRFMVWHSEH
jgi:hypothetical protein